MGKLGVVPIQARRSAERRLAGTGAGPPWRSWREDPDVTEVRWLAGGQVSVLRTSLDAAVREFSATGDPADALGSIYLLQALVLSVLGDETTR